MHHAFSDHVNAISAYKKTFCNVNRLLCALLLNFAGHMLFAMYNNITLIWAHYGLIHICILALVINNFHDTEMQVQSLYLTIITGSHGFWLQIAGVGSSFDICADV